jgi:hypothetical protein
LIGETYRPGLAIGQTIYIHLRRPTRGRWRRRRRQLLIFDASAVTAPATTTLAADINDTVTTITLNATYGPLKGTMILVGQTEYMFVTAGTTTASLTVVRGQQGTAAAPPRGGQPGHYRGRPGMDPNPFQPRAQSRPGSIISMLLAQ